MNANAIFAQNFKWITLFDEKSMFETIKQKGRLPTTSIKRKKNFNHFD